MVPQNVFTVCLNVVLVPTSEMVKVFNYLLVTSQFNVWTDILLISNVNSRRTELKFRRTDRCTTCCVFRNTDIQVKY